MKCVWAICTFPHPDSMMMLALLYVGCEAPSPEITVLDKAQILEQIEQTPLKAKALCSQIAEASQREFCIQFALQALPKDALNVTRELCSTLEGTAKGECWFQVAERSLLMSDCALAIPFVKECHLHLTYSTLVNSKATTWEELEQVASEYGMDPSSSKDGVILYQYWFRNISPLMKADCQAFPNPEWCRKAMELLYFGRLKNWDMDSGSSCDPISTKIWHGDQILFSQAFETVVARKCGASSISE